MCGGVDDISWVELTVLVAIKTEAKSSIITCCLEQEPSSFRGIELFRVIFKVLSHTKLAERCDKIRDSKDTRDSSFSAKSSRHFESRSSLHVSDLAALTITLINSKYVPISVPVCAGVDDISGVELTVLVARKKRSIINQALSHTVWNFAE